jgi:plasmid stability protein
MKAAPMNLSIKDVPEDVAARLRDRAARNHRSLQGELMAIVCAAAQGEAAGPSGRAASSSVDAGDGRGTASTPQGWKTVEQLLADRRSRGGVPGAAGAALPLAVDIVRAQRDRR